MENGESVGNDPISDQQQRCICSPNTVHVNWHVLSSRLRQDFVRCKQALVSSQIPTRQPGILANKLNFHHANHLTHVQRGDIGGVVALPKVQWCDALNSPPRVYLCHSSQALILPILLKSNHFLFKLTHANAWRRFKRNGSFVYVSTYMKRIRHIFEGFWRSETEV